jgi:hypothetical protein
MITSKNIRENKKFPHFITNHPVFQTEREFDKIFPHIGLKNFMCSIDESTGQIPFVIDNGKFGTKLNLVPGEYPAWAKLLWKILGTPIFITDLAIDVLEFFRFKRDNKNLRVVFSSDGDAGMWDISTMAMRGINSCQSWSAGRRSNLIGSMIDPCCGIIYLTDNTVSYGYGTNMLHRAVVRYVVHKEHGPCLFLEKVYSRTPATEFELRAINLLFACMLYRKTGLPVVYDFCLVDPKTVLAKIAIPESPIVLETMNCASYRDSGIQYRGITKNFFKHSRSLSIFKRHFSYK